ncbi:uncharacterized protein LOC123562753 [Mercenaria mercenaria]|uniref:uncharacterized protein LOC123562753 n=1 Tax=Mercenaria mercenaria TaxID=6596 RepID=UPI00234F675F|nr:uncharacterized protein LOC123562753 [Mercenaria mercenaria]
MEEAQQNQNENQQDSAPRVTDIQENKCSSPRTGKGEKENEKKKKPRKRKRSAKQIDRWNRYRENKYRNYMHDAVNGHADPARRASYAMPYVYPLIWPVIRPADLPISRGVLYADTRYERQVPDTQAWQNTSGVSQHSKSFFSDDDPKQQFADTSARVRVSDTLKEDLIPKATVSTTTTTPDIVSSLRADAEVFVPGVAARCLEQLVPNTNTPATERVDHPGDVRSQKIDPQPKADADMFVGEAGPLDEIPKVFETPAKLSDTPLPLPETRLRNTDVPAKLKTDHDIRDEDMFGILLVYADSGLHNEFDKVVCSNTTKEDFGYIYFSISDL